MLVLILLLVVPPFLICIICLMGYLAKPPYVDINFVEPPALSWINKAHAHWTAEKFIVKLKNNQTYQIPKNGQGHFILLYNWEVHTNLIEGRDKVIIPAGLTTDLASIPKALRSLLSVLNNSVYAAIMHDYYYRNPEDPEAKTVSKAAADNAFYWGMREAGVSRITAGIMYLGVHWGGHSSYTRD